MKSLEFCHTSSDWGKFFDLDEYFVVGVEEIFMDYFRILLDLFYLTRLLRTWLFVVARFPGEALWLSPPSRYNPQYPRINVLFESDRQRQETNLRFLSGGVATAHERSIQGQEILQCGIRVSFVSGLTSRRS